MRLIEIIQSSMNAHRTIAVSKVKLAQQIPRLDSLSAPLTDSAKHLHKQGRSKNAGQIKTTFFTAGILLALYNACIICASSGRKQWGTNLKFL